MNFRSLLEATDFLFFVNFINYQNFLNFHKNAEFSDFSEKIKIYVKIILFRPMVKIAVFPQDFQPFGHGFSWKSNFSLNFLISLKLNFFAKKRFFLGKCTFRTFSVWNSSFTEIDQITYGKRKARAAFPALGGNGAGKCTFS